jgi:hypothetical protein
LNVNTLRPKFGAFSPPGFDAQQPLLGPASDIANHVKMRKPSTAEIRHLVDDGGIGLFSFLGRMV